tara:strand:- start:181 stop:816 length:636 start_codon:yes stop_codon:yes gene_type:complete
MPSVTVQVEANADDGYRYGDGMGGGFTYNNNAAYVSIGALNSGPGSEDTTCYFRFLSVAIPGNATITAAKLQYKLNTAYSVSSKTCDIHAEDADSAGAIANDSAMTTSQAAATSAKTTWTLATSSDTTNFLDSADFTAVIAEVIARGGWSTGQNITIHLLNPTDASMSEDREMRIKSHDSAGADAVKLVVTYTLPPKAGGIPQTLMLHDLF